MRNLLLAIAVLAGGCGGANDVRPTVLEKVPAGTQELTSKPDDQVTADRLAEARKMGYRIVTQDGVDMYCRTDLKTGSRVQRETVCLTRKEIDELREQTQNGLANTMRALPPPAGH